ncbi:acyl-CoA dehydrogenase family protein [Actinomadura livida]|uniref:Acyl-CoA dehydrogenase family protein n=1 Tax=Actinomadura livida TaxID=79909 RepID=A0A7W7IFF0_9ACTN|nr:MULTISPECIES: acyl-CoA dehydrogenase family protein [Actinomadura]MBB4776011.1 alkylation response protein AidB-like acyl-CoA dehydrogenase [Actinomadura catellatispora]GGU16117.1 acyl-CoA dehydrogenase [Actinomadura livida]
MDVRLSSEQQALRDAAARLADDLGPKSVAELGDGARAAKLDTALEATGWRELRTPADGNRPLASAVEAAIVAEELGRGLADTSFLGPTLAAELRRRASAPPATVPETVLLTPDLSRLAVAGGAGEPCSGTAIDVQGITSALALAEVAGGHELVTVPVYGTSPSRDLTRPAAEVSGPPAVRLPGTQTPLSAADIEGWTAFVVALTCADLVGTMRGAVELACSYAGVRQQYGTAIGSFQSVQHMLADAHVSVEGSRSVALHAAWAADTLPAGEALDAAAVAKAYCARAARAVCETAIQVHGGIGNTWECLAHVHLRRALLSTQLLGGVGAHLDRVAARREIGGVPGGLR